jgi:hypothetical protein
MKVRRDQKVVLMRDRPTPKARLFVPAYDHTRARKLLRDLAPIGGLLLEAHYARHHGAARTAATLW